MNRQPEVFMCYARTDTGVVTKLHRVLQDADIEVWRDETAIMPGDLWPAEIDAAVEAARILLLCLGRDPLGGWRQHECQAFIAQARGGATRRLIPVLLPGGPDPDALPAMIRCRQAVDLRDHACWDTGCSRLVDAIRIHLRRSGFASATTIPLLSVDRE